MKVRRPDDTGAGSENVVQAIIWLFREYRELDAVMCKRQGTKGQVLVPDLRRG